MTRGVCVREMSVLERYLYQRDSVLEVSVKSSSAVPLSKNTNSVDIGQEDAGTRCADHAHFICWVQHSDGAFCRVSGIDVSFSSCEKLIRCDVIDSAVEAIVSFFLCFSAIAAVGSHRFSEVASLLSFIF